MLTATVQRELDLILETALMPAGSKISIRQIAERIYESESALVEQLKRPWIVERLMWLMNRRRQNLPSENQMILPGFPNLPKRITLRNGKRPMLSHANLRELKEFREVLMKRKGSRLVIVEKLIAFIAPYAAKKPGITVGDVISAQNDPQI